MDHSRKQPISGALPLYEAGMGASFGSMSEMPTGFTARLARKLVVDLSIMTVVGIVLAVIGPFGSAGAPLATRLVSWIGLAWLGYMIYNPMGYLVGWLREKLQLPEFGLWAGVTLVATVPMAVAVWCIDFLPNAPAMPTAEQALSAYINVLAIGASITILFILIDRANGRAAQHPSGDPVLADKEESPAQTIGTRFHERLPPALGSDLIALEMEDHYVRAHTVTGSELILLRMRDAVSELDGIDGLQVHRSWWVARDAVTGSRRDGRNLRLTLKKGLEAPVSRSAAPVLKDQGWL
jgi:hypothetical protein